MPFFWLVHPTFNLKEAKRVSQVPDASLAACHALGPRQSLGNLTIAQCSGQALQRVCNSFVQASGTLKPTPTALLLSQGCIPLGRYGSPAAYSVPCVRFTIIVPCLEDQVRRPRNTRYGLVVNLPDGDFLPRNSSRAPYKKHQAALGAQRPASVGARFLRSTECRC